jgi:orotidine-5'-phosphate decarboxylase
MNAIDKYNTRARAIDSLLCVGLDSDLSLIPPRFQAEAMPQFAFNRWIIDTTHHYAAAFKINTAFYEARGAAGWQEMDQTIAYLRTQHPDILTICDAKRGDIGSTSSAYARAIFDHLGFDSVTLNPYLGRDALDPFLKRADKGCILLCRTSNPGSGELQSLLVDGQPLWLHVARKVAEEWNTHGNCMLVVGATYPEELRQVRAITPSMPLLIPGVGTQGGDVETTVRAGMDASGRGMLINASRAILTAVEPGAVAASLRNAIRDAIAAI